MGTYATWSGDVLARYPLLSRVNSDAAAADSAYLAPSERQLESKLAPRYSVPFVNTGSNATVKDLVIDMVWLKAHNPYDDKRSKAMRDDLDKRCEALLRGKAHMIGTDGVSLGTSDISGAYSTTMQYPPTFGHGDIQDFRVSSVMLTDEEAKRE